MITPSFGLTATERVLPKLALDFTTASLDPRVTFTRSGATATRVNSSGYIETMAADTPRFDYDPVTLLCKGLLVEEARTNLMTYSEDMSAWTTKLNVAIGTNTTTSPANTATADKIKETAVSGQHYIGFNSATATVSAVHTTSFYAKADERNVVFAQILDGGTQSNGFGVSFQLTGAGSVSTQSVYGAGVYSSASIVSAGNGWYRCTIAGTTNGSGTNIRTNLYLKAAFAGSVSYLGVLDYGLYIWGAQLEAGAFATSYIPTTTTALTRNADVAVMTGTNFSDWYNAGAGGVVARVLPSTVSGTRPALQFDDGTVNEIIALRGNTTNPELYIVDGGTQQAQVDAGTIAANTAYNLGAAWGTDNCAAAVNGGAAVTDTTATIPTVTQARLGSDGTNYLNGQIQTVRYWPQRIINAEVQAFSK